MLRSYIFLNSSILQLWSIEVKKNLDFVASSQKPIISYKHFTDSFLTNNDFYLKGTRTLKLQI